MSFTPDIQKALNEQINLEFVSAYTYLSMVAYFESKKTGEKEYVFGKGGGEKLAEELQAPLLGQLPLQQPDWNDDDFAPSIYQQDHDLGKIYLNIASKVVELT
jgi:ATP-binding protein involved in chromosome partitioning